MIEFVNKKIAHMRRPFIIEQDGTSQTRIENHGRLGFYVERACGIDPNNDQRPDFGNWELKTCQSGKKISIGTMSESEWSNIVCTAQPSFEKSVPYTKMKNTIFVLYEKLTDYPEPEYIVRGSGTCQLGAMDEFVKKQLQRDYSYICDVIKIQSRSRDNLTTYLQESGSVSGKYLSLTYKGQGYNGYNYPAWNFTVGFMKKISYNN